MNVIKFLTKDFKYQGWKKFYGYKENFLECKSWVDSGNIIEINNKFQISDIETLKDVLKYKI